MKLHIYIYIYLEHLFRGAKWINRCVRAALVFPTQARSITAAILLLAVEAGLRSFVVSTGRKQHEGSNNIWNTKKHSGLLSKRGYIYIYRSDIPKLAVDSWCWNVSQIRILCDFLILQMGCDLTLGGTSQRGSHRVHRHLGPNTAGKMGGVAPLKIERLDQIWWHERKVMYPFVLKK